MPSIINRAGVVPEFAEETGGDEEVSGEKIGSETEMTEASTEVKSADGPAEATKEARLGGKLPSAKP